MNRTALAEQSASNKLDCPGFSIAAYEEAGEKYRRAFPSAIALVSRNPTKPCS